MKLSAANMAILKNMSDLMTRELWGAYEDSYKQRILQLKKASHPPCHCSGCVLTAGKRCFCPALLLLWCCQDLRQGLETLCQLLCTPPGILKNIPRVQ